MNNGDDLVEIDLGKKVQIIKVQSKDLGSKDHTLRTPPRTPREENEHKRLGFVGAPAQLATPKLKSEPSADEEASPFLDTHETVEWI